MTSTPARALDLLRSERVDDPERVLADLARDDPAQPDALPFLGIVRHTPGRTDQAVELIHVPLRLAPDHAGAWNNLEVARKSLQASKRHASILSG